MKSDIKNQLFESPEDIFQAVQQTMKDINKEEQSDQLRKRSDTTLTLSSRQDGTIFQKFRMIFNFILKTLLYYEIKILLGRSNTNTYTYTKSLAVF